MANGVKTITNKEAEDWLREIIDSNIQVKFGVIGDPKTPGADSAQAGKKKRTETGISVTSTPLVKVATAHEFGYPAGNIPERSYLRSTFDENKDKLYEVFLKSMKAIGLKYGTSTAEQEKVFALVGEWMVNKIKAKFTSNSWPALKDPTRRGKNKNGRSKPLIDTGQLRASISYKIVKGGEK